jgi:hypothetical protein
VAPPVPGLNALLKLPQELHALRHVKHERGGWRTRKDFDWDAVDRLRCKKA